MAPAELESWTAQLREADRRFFGGRFADARTLYLEAWAAHPPNPLALVMAAHSAFRGGDKSAAADLLERSRLEAKSQPFHPPAPTEVLPEDTSRMVFSGGRSALCLEGTRVKQIALPSPTDPRGRLLFAFQRRATRDFALAPDRPVIWFSPVLAGRWDHPDPTDERARSVGEFVEVQDVLTGAALGRVPHRVEHVDTNEEYHGAVAVSDDGTVLATGSDEEQGIRIWSTSGFKEQAHLSTSGQGSIEWLRLSRDGRTVVAAFCDHLWVWHWEQATPPKRIAPPYSSCGYGAGWASPFGKATLDDRGALLAVLHLASGPSSEVIPESDRGFWTELWAVEQPHRMDRWPGSLGDGTDSALSPNGRLFVQGTASGASLHDFTDSSVRELGLRGGPLTFSPDGRWFAIGCSVFDLKDPRHPKLAFDPSTDPLQGIGTYELPRRL